MNHAHRTKSKCPGPLVVKLGGDAVDNPDAAPWLWSALAELHAQRRSVGGVVLVHGGGKAVDRMIDRLGLTTVRRDGIRLTPPEQIDPIVGVLAGSVNKALVGQLQSHGAPSVGLCLGDGGTCTVRTTRRHGFDAGRVGEVTGGNSRLVMALIEAGMLPVISSIGLDADGLALNVNADEAAAGVAAIVGASGLMLLTDVAGVLDRDGKVLVRLDAAQVEERIADGTIRGGMIPKVRGALEAAQACGAPVTIAAWSRPEDLAALVRGAAVGTTVVAPAVGAPTVPGTEVMTVPTLDEPELPALASSAHAGGAACTP